MEEEFTYKITFEMDYAFQTKYHVVITPGKISFQDNVTSEYVTMQAIINQSQGENNGEYTTHKKETDKLLTFIDKEVYKWNCYYPNLILDQYAKWKLHIQFPNDEIMTSGYFGYHPTSFKKLITLINNLLPTVKGKRNNWIKYQAI